MGWHPAVWRCSTESLPGPLLPALSECGIDGVKVDVQSTIGLVGSGAGGGPALAAQFHASLEDSARR